MPPMEPTASLDDVDFRDAVADETCRRRNRAADETVADEPRLTTMADADSTDVDMDLSDDDSSAAG